MVEFHWLESLARALRVGMKELHRCELQVHASVPLPGEWQPGLVLLFR